MKRSSKGCRFGARPAQAICISRRTPHGLSRRRTVQTRVSELGGAALPTPWLIVHSWQVYDAYGLEAQAKRACAQWHQQGEMFAAHHESLRGTVDRIIAEDRRLLEQHVGASLAPGALDTWLGDAQRIQH
ncbi:hypothetical protein AB4Y45_33930 [Paraburkholderia sp. EG287A]|uniref:hypothetical protein n=1 Tax=Paraburkholderia sp. EG287A TaxID=3237012 RepID=UPI0034D346D1